MDIHIANAEIRADARNVLASTRAARPKNTTLAYEPKQREFKAFCERKQYHDADTVTEDKLLLFLVEEVTSRPLKVKSRKAADDVLHEETRLSWRSVRGYVTALTDLYRAQKAMGMNSHQSPREDNVREYLRSLQRRDAQLDREQFADKGRDTLLDGYTEDEFEGVCRELWARGGALPECHLRTLVDLLLGHYMLTRGSDRRSAEISNLFTFEFKETIGALRHKNPLVCMLSGLAFYLLYRWDLTDEPFPDFSERSAWYGIRLIKRTSGDRQEPLSYTSQREWVAKAFEYVGISSSKKTHIGHAAGAKTAELKGVSEEQIRRAGRWSQEQMVGCYLNSLPREFMRTMAGHPSQAGCFEIRRASLTPPDALLSQIWPELDIWKGQFGPHVDQINDLAATGATNLLFYLREVILQDSVVLRQLFPDNAVWTHSVFQHEAYSSFAKQVTTCLDEGESPTQLSALYQAMPLLMDHLKAMDARGALRAARSEQQAARSEQQAAEVKALVSSIAESQSEQLRLLTSGSLMFRLEALPAATSTQQLPPPLSLSFSLAGSSQYVSACANGAASPEPEPQPPSYRMSRGVKTVDCLWREWTVGLGGGPSIQALDIKWGSRWRAGRRSELQWYSLRLEAIKEIRRIAQAQRTSEEAAMWQLNMQQQNMGCSLDQLCKRLRASRKAKN
ncbi:hypothetical protein K469DRAFT_331606 [Zopfia rhizophila CBS 207.26]|uniref:Transcription activator GCR1-like domain-containing protein n=1 Tax=Zopfia rhizophila CBS 207.26 TaxID=1314779 RepID=A0A6A6DJP7_9PEZI|nr:hypothetical protein K469DRAFT_331606 [Zopfia rhizophila CBS 207.26]